MLWASSQGPRKGRRIRGPIVSPPSPHSRKIDRRWWPH
jgi:hypothetical protein